MVCEGAGKCLLMLLRFIGGVCDERMDGWRDGRRGRWRLEVEVFMSGLRQMRKSRLGAQQSDQAVAVISVLAVCFATIRNDGRARQYRDVAEI